MKLSISNIAWEQHDDLDILKLLHANGVTGIEIAPTKIWANWTGSSNKAAISYQRMMADQGFELPAIQGVMYGKPELQLFEESSHEAFLEHIKLVSDLANGLGSKVMVFGAPKNRCRGQTPHSDAVNIARDFFYRAGEVALAHECCLALENSPKEYGCDFATNILDAKELVDSVDHQGFRLHVDSAGLHMCGGDIDKMIKAAGNFVHYHISEPMLQPIAGGIVDQQRGIDSLRAIEYAGWVSIEMTQPGSDMVFEQSLIDTKNFIF
jgi:D-psicose/D-tagatose/L-ribulose 3-epimerase